MFMWIIIELSCCLIVEFLKVLDGFIVIVKFFISIIVFW